MMKKAWLAFILVFTMLPILSMAAGPSPDRFTELPSETQASLAPTPEGTYSDALIHEGLLQTMNAGFYPDSEFFAEGHVILGTKLENSRMEVYLTCSGGGFGFMGGAFVMQNGWSDACTVLLDKKGGEWTFREVLTVESDLDYPSIMPASVIAKLGSSADDEEIQRQIRQQVQAYLDSIGRTEPIMEYAEIDEPLSGMLVAASNFRMYIDGDYPLGNTTKERLEGGVRYLYTKAWNPDENGVADPVYSTAHGEVHMDGTTGTETLTKVRKEDGALLETITIRVDLYELTINLEDAGGSVKYVFPFDGYQYYKPTISREGSCGVDSSRLDLVISELPGE